MRFLPTRRSRLLAVLVAVITAVLLAVLVPVIYVNFFKADPPPTMSFDDFDTVAAPGT